MVLLLAERESVLVVLLPAELGFRLVVLRYLEEPECFCKEIPRVRGHECIRGELYISGETRDRV